MRGGTRNVAISDGSGSTPLDVAVSRVATRQHGVVSLAQLEALGLGASGVRDRVVAGRLHRVHRGVYSVGHSSLKIEGRWIAAVLACGEGAVLSHRSAAALLDLRRAVGPLIDGDGPTNSRSLTQGNHGPSDPLPHRYGHHTRTRNPLHDRPAHTPRSRRCSRPAEARARDRSGRGHGRLRSQCIE